jgi:type II secretory pathway component GspD/PulD (secretin)
LPVHSLNPEQLIRDLAPLIPASDTVIANESGKAIIMTASQQDIHRIAAIVTALDSTSTAEVSVFPLNYADAKSVADELKELFQSADSNVNNTAAQISFGPRFGRPVNDGAGSGKEKNASPRPVFVADEQMNAVVASAPPEAMPTVAHVIEMLDKPGQDLTDVEIFPLLHADPGEVVDEISTVFGGVSTPVTQPASRQAGFQPSGPGRFQPTPQPASTESARLKREAAVMAVADRRTQSVIVAASEHTMAQVRKMIDRLDQGEKGVMRVSVLETGCADPETISDGLTALFASSTSAASKQPQLNTPDSARATATATWAASGITGGGTSTSAASSGLH